MNIADQRDRRIMTVSAFVMYAVIYLLYVLKYSFPNRPFPFLTLIAFGLVAPVILFGILTRRRKAFLANLPRHAFPIAVLLISVALFVLMRQFDPTTIGIGRAAALNEFNSLLFDGTFPYLAPSKPSGFPILFLLAAPFHFLGEVGLYQILGLLLFAWVASGWCEGANRLQVIALLVAAPIFAFEVCVRSELITNAIILLAAIEFTRRCQSNLRASTAILCGVSLGLAASTRAIFLPAYLITLPLIMREPPRRLLLLLVMSAVVTFVITLLPFMIWDWSQFWNVGPFAIQMSHTPLAVLVLSLAFSAVIGLKVRDFRTAYITVAAILFGIVLVNLVMSLLSHGFAATIIHDDYFDPAYFGFALPFAIISIVPPKTLTR